SLRLMDTIWTRLERKIGGIVALLLLVAMAGVGYLIAGVPDAGMLALLTFFLSVVPIGPPLIWIPAALWLFHEGWTGWGVFMLVWGYSVSSMDNVVKPWLISEGCDRQFLFFFFGLFGGAVRFGLFHVML